MALRLVVENGLNVEKLDWPFSYSLKKCHVKNFGVVYKLIKATRVVVLSAQKIDYVNIRIPKLLIIKVIWTE